jgi:hypothetical protein
LVRLNAPFASDVSQQFYLEFVQTAAVVLFLALFVLRQNSLNILHPQSEFSNRKVAKEPL